MSPEDMVEYVGDIESKLNWPGITRLQTGYDTEENVFLADKTWLSDAIQLEYGNRATQYAIWQALYFSLSLKTVR